MAVQIVDDILSNIFKCDDRYCLGILKASAQKNNSNTAEIQSKMVSEHST